MSYGTCAPFICTNLIEAYTSTATAAGTTTLTAASAYQQYFTGSTTQTVQLPVTSTLSLGQQFSITNNSTGLVTVVSSGNNVVSILDPNTSNVLTCVSVSGTTAASWSGGNIGTISVGTSPQAICFDGTNIWVSNNSSNNVTKISAATGQVIGNYDVGSSPSGLCFDGTYIWVVTRNSNNVTKLLATTGATIATYSIASLQYDIVFDGTFLWVPAGNTVVKLSTAGATVATASPTGTGPWSVCFDGTFVWTGNFNANNVTKILAASGAVIGNYSVGTGPAGIGFDGTYVWTANYSSNNVTKLLASDGSVVGTYSVGTNPYGMCFDGTYVWVCNLGSSNVTKLLASTGENVGTYSVGTNPYKIVFDGTNLWTANSGSNNVTKLSPPNMQLGLNKTFSSNVTVGSNRANVLTVNGYVKSINFTSAQGLFYLISASNFLTYIINPKNTSYYENNLNPTNSYMSYNTDAQYYTPNMGIYIYEQIIHRLAYHLKNKEVGTSLILWFMSAIGSSTYGNSIMAHKTGNDQISWTAFGGTVYTTISTGYNTNFPSTAPSSTYYNVWW